MHVQSCINNLGDIYSFGPVFRSKLYKPTFIHKDDFLVIYRIQTGWRQLIFQVSLIKPVFLSQPYDKDGLQKNICDL